MVTLNVIIFLILQPIVQAGDCIVGSWLPWEPCNQKCGVGIQQRKRLIVQERGNYFDKECPHLEESKPCGVLNNGCEHLCEQTTGDCHCKQGYILNNDRKTCSDKNECLANDGLGPCSQRCENINGTYSCTCFKGYELSNKHDCVYKSADICARFQKRNQLGACECVNGLEGPKCDRNSSLCDTKTCPLVEQVCSDLHIIKQRCYNKNFQINILLNIPHNVYMKNSIRNEILRDIESIFEGHKLNVDILSSTSKVRRSSFVAVYIQEFYPTRVKRSFTYVKLIAFDAVNRFQPIPASDACSILQNTNVKCISQKDCFILKSDGVPCPDLYEHFSTDKHSKKSLQSPLWWVYVLIIALLIIILIPLVFYCYKKKGRFMKRKNENSSCQYTAHVQEPLLDGIGAPMSPISSLQQNESPDLDNISCESPYYESIDEYQKETRENKVDGDRKDLTVALPSSPNEERYVAPPSRKNHNEF